MPRTRITNTQDRQAQILRAGCELSKEVGFGFMTRDKLADKAGVSPPLVTAYFGSMLNFRDRLMRFAIDNGVVHVIADGIAARNPIALKAPEALKTQAKAYIARG